MRKAVAKSVRSGIISRKGLNDNVQKVGIIDTAKYAGVSDSEIRSGIVVLTDKQKQHIVDRRGQTFFDEYSPFFQEVVEDPEYIFKDPQHENTAIASKTISVNGKHINLVIRLAVEGDNPELENSIITAIAENGRRYQQRLRNNTPLYKSE